MVGCAEPTTSRDTALSGVFKIKLGRFLSLV